MKIRLLNVDRLDLIWGFKNGEVIEIEECDHRRRGYWKLKGGGKWFLILGPYDVACGEGVSWEKTDND